MDNLSGGQRQSIAVGRAAAWGPHIVLLNEPSAALGVEQRKQGGAIGTFDLLTFRLEVVAPGGETAGVCTNSFIFPRQP